MDRTRVARSESTSLVAEVRENATLLGGALALMWALEIVDFLIFGGALDALGVRPRSLQGLWGVLMAPLLHGGFGHLMANSAPFFLLGALSMVRRRMDFFVVTAASALTAGLGTWLIGAGNSVHIGASGVVFGYLGFLLGRGWYERRPSAIALSVAVGLGFGGMLWGLVPHLQAGISWEGHLFGFLGGLACARLLGRALRARRDIG